jgi:hypothetical protein
MQSDDNSSHPSSSDESPSDATECETLSELKRKMTSGKTTVDDGDIDNSYDSSASSCNDGERSPATTARKKPTQQKRSTTIQTPKKKAKTKKSSKIKSNDASNYWSKSSHNNKESSSLESEPRTIQKPRKNTTKKKTPKKTAKKKTPSTNGKGKKAGSTTFTPDELLLLSKAYMKVSCNAKHGTDKKADKFWDDIALHYVELVKKSNSINEECVSYSVINIQRNAESL